MGTLTKMEKKEMVESEVATNKPVCAVCGNNLRTSKVYCSRQCAGVAKRKRRNVVCETCGIKFTDCEAGTRRFCSTECSVLAQRTREYKTCENCGVPFLSVNQRFCSRACLKDYPSVSEKTTVVCEHCKKEFGVHFYRAESARFCSRKCRHESRRRHKTCLQCGEDFYGPSWEIDKKIFCNNTCSKIYRSQHTHNRSIWERDLFDCIHREYGDSENNPVIRHGEYFFYPDIVCGNTIIECLGDYWHCNPSKYSATYYHSARQMYASDIWLDDAIRTDKLNSLGYHVFNIWEEWYKDNRDNVVTACLGILSKNYNKSDVLDIRDKMQKSGFSDISNRNRIKRRPPSLNMEKQPEITFVSVASLDNKDRGGFGSTG